MAGAIAGCGEVVRKGGFSDVQKAMSERGVPESVQWRDGSADDQSADEAVHALLDRDLTVDAAVQVALLENPSVQATYEDLGIAQANLVQAGLLKNPVFVGAALFGSVSPAYDFDVAQSFLDALLIPAQKRIAGAQFEEARLRVAGEVFDLTAQVRAAYYRLQGAEQLVEILRAVVTTTEAAVEFAERLDAAGNVSDLELATERALHEEARAELMHAQADTIDPREDLRRLLGLSGSQVVWKVAPALPAIPDGSVKCWGYNGRTPGPTIEAVEGDRVRILVTNRLPEHTSIHWHGILLPNGMDGVSGLNQPPIRPGETFVYEFPLRQNGTQMYHPHADEMLQMAVGMMGLFVIHPRERHDAPADRDFAIMLHEWAVHPGTYRPDPAVMTDFNMFTFNSKVYPGTSPLVVKTGQRVKIRVAT